MEHAILHETIDGQRVDFYPETGFDDVMETDGEDAVTLRMVLQGLRTDISDETQIRETADTALQNAITAEAQARTKAVSDEATVRQTADATLQTNIDAKATKATTLAGYGISNAYTKTETNNLLDTKISLTNAYTKPEINNLLNQKISISQGAENKGKVLQVGNDGNVILSSGGGHKLVDELPSVSSAEENVVYFVQNEVEETPEDLNIAQAINDLDNRISIIETGADYVVASGHTEDNTQWYRRWKSGWLEQGGIATLTTNLLNTTITMTKHFIDNAYTVVGAKGGADNSAVGFSIEPFTTNTFKVGVAYSGNINRQFSWYACGQGGEE